ncbi:protein PLASTID TRANSCRIPTIONALLY ACTIVE 10 [Rhododendron vialii]|uniref:protein PLASTID TRANSCRIPTIONALLY ACTIVE 10 n=1 Tax=Rhododendron vialii TaxID=182163 RepID=UPI00265FA74B|nr:protein PLASTID TRANSCRIPTIONALLY ACTIVE 10 [Rhododendron vialii]
MRPLQTHHHLFPFPFLPPKPLPKPYYASQNSNPKPFPKPLLQNLSPKPLLAANVFAGEGETPVDESFLEEFAPQNTEPEDEARRRNWIERGWAPWDEILSYEAKFARTSINEGEEVPLQNPDSVEAFKMMSPKYRRSKMKEMGLTEDEFYEKQFELKGEIPEPLKTSWTGPLVVRHVPPRDWPPRGWEVDREELEFIRGAHKLQAVRVDLEKVEEEASTDTDELCLERYKVFLKQYNEWVVANKDRLEKESYKYDQDYYPGRRKRGKDYEEGMYELPFYYPGQICAGKVTTLHLHQGAFVDIGGVHDGWVPIRRNDWYWLRHHIKVGMFVIVEILAKRDPYRFRFPIEMRFVDPNVDHLIFHKFEFPPIFHREDDTNLDELRRDSGRPPIPVKDPGIKVEEEPLKSNHPYVEKLWQIHNAEQMIMDDMELNPDKYKDQKLTELTDDEDFDEENSVEYTKAYHKKALLPKMILKISVKELDLEAALEERKFHNKLREEAKERGEKYRVTKLRRNIEMDEYDFVHWRRSLEEREALIRDNSSRQALGLPLEEPGRFVDPSFFGSFGRDEYDPSNPVYRYDYWGEPKNTEKSRQKRLADAYTKSVVGKGKVWYRMSVEDFAKQQRLWEAQSKGKVTQEEDDGEESDQDDEDEYEDDDYLYSILSDPKTSIPDQPIVVNGTESTIFIDNRMYDN